MTAASVAHVVFFLEGPSEQDFLQVVLPSILPSHVHAHFQVFEGKQDLEKRLPWRLKGWQLPNTRFVVLRDQDSGDCRVIKQRLQALCAQAGKPDVVVRIACRELESFFVGDWNAVAKAFGKPALSALDKRAIYRTPDELGDPASELKKHISGYQKRDGARKIAPHLSVECNRSRSFQVLMHSITGL